MRAAAVGHQCVPCVVSWEGHLGGLLAGGTLGLAYGYAPAKRRMAVQAGAAAGILVIAIALVVLKTSQLTGAG